jgi:hypothetical protein
MPAAAQQFFRISADVSVKTKLNSGEQNLTVGKVFYDRNEKKVLYDLYFPEKEIIITADTVTYRIKDGKIVHRMFSPSLVDFSIFHLALSSNLPNYGLKTTQYQIDEVKKEGEMVITTWLPPDRLSDELGKIMISVMDKRLQGVIFFGPDGEIDRKQLFEEYITKDGLVFPGKIIEISYSDQGESYQVMNFKNLQVDELENNHMYSYQLPDHY